MDHRELGDSVLPQDSMEASLIVLLEGQREQVRFRKILQQGKHTALTICSPVSACGVTLLNLLQIIALCFGRLYSGSNCLPLLLIGERVDLS